MSVYVKVSVDSSFPTILDFQSFWCNGISLYINYIVAWLNVIICEGHKNLMIVVSFCLHTLQVLTFGASDMLLSQYLWFCMCVFFFFNISQDRFLAYSPEQHPIVLQIGGNNLENLAKATELANAYHYDEINFKFVLYIVLSFQVSFFLLITELSPFTINQLWMS